MTVDGLKMSLSRYGPSETMERILAAIAKLGMAVLARIDLSAAAAKVGIELRSTEVVLFGNPKTGTPLMQDAQTMGIDLPLKILVWRYEQDRTWVAYNDPFWLAGRHAVAEGSVAANGDCRLRHLWKIAAGLFNDRRVPTGFLFPHANSQIAIETAEGP